MPGYQCSLLPVLLHFNYPALQLQIKVTALTANKRQDNMITGKAGARYLSHPLPGKPGAGGFGTEGDLCARCVRAAVRTAQLGLEGAVAESPGCVCSQREVSQGAQNS